MILKKLHLVFDLSLTEALSKALVRAGFEIAGTDVTLEQFRDAAQAGKIDADIAIISGTSGVVNKRDSIQRLKEVRISEPDLRLIVILPQDADRQWISEIGMLGIYDVYAIDQFTIEDVCKWISEKKTVGSIFPHESDLPGNIAEPQIELVETPKPKPSKAERLQHIWQWLKPTFDKADLDEDEELIQNEAPIQFRLLGQAVIAIGGVRSRTGATHTALQLAHLLADHGLKTAFVELGQTDSASFMDASDHQKKFTRREIDFFPNVDDVTGVIGLDYQAVVLDTGTLLTDKQGDLIRNERLNEWFRASLQVLTVGAAPWDIAFVAKHIDHIAPIMERSKAIVVNFATTEMYDEVFDLLKQYKNTVVHNDGGFDPLCANERLLPIVKSLLPHREKRRKFVFH